MNFNFGEVLASAWQIAWKHIWTQTYLRLSRPVDHRPINIETNA